MSAHDIKSDIRRFLKAQIISDIEKGGVKQLIEDINKTMDQIVSHEKQKIPVQVVLLISLEILIELTFDLIVKDMAKSG